MPSRLRPEVPVGALYRVGVGGACGRAGHRAGTRSGHPPDTAGPFPRHERRRCPAAGAVHVDVELLDRDRPAEQLVVRPPDGPHAAPAEPGLQAVAADDPALLAGAPLLPPLPRLHPRRCLVPPRLLLMPLFPLLLRSPPFDRHGTSPPLAPRQSLLGGSPVAQHDLELLPCGRPALLGRRHVQRVLRSAVRVVHLVDRVAPSGMVLLLLPGELPETGFQLITERIRVELDPAILRQSVLQSPFHVQHVHVRVLEVG